MSPIWGPAASSHRGYSNDEKSRDYDDAEKGMYDSSLSLPIQAPPVAYLDTKGGETGKGTALHVETVEWPLSPVHEGLTPFDSHPELSLSWPKGFTPPAKPPTPKNPAPAKPKPKVSRKIRFRLWFNTYRKFFTLVVTLNATGIVLAACGKFPYAENHLGALVLGNLLMAILMRNEFFFRIVYWLCIHGLRSVGSRSRLCQSPVT